MKMDFAGAIKKALDATTADEQIAKDITDLCARLTDGKGYTVPPTAGQIEAITLQAIQEQGLIGMIQKAIVDEAIRAATSKPEPATK
jgi:hypothetical protein